MRYRFAVNHNENQMTVRAGIDNVITKTTGPALMIPAPTSRRGESRTFRSRLAYEF